MSESTEKRLLRFQSKFVAYMHMVYVAYSLVDRVEIQSFQNEEYSSSSYGATARSRALAILKWRPVSYTHLDVYKRQV